MNHDAQHALRESLADYAHAAWSGWHKYLLSKSTANPDGSVTIPPDLAARWQRQMDTEYAALPEAEKASDRREADKMLKIMATQSSPLRQVLDDAGFEPEVRAVMAEWPGLTR